MQPAKAHWVNRDTIGLLGAEPGDTYRLYFSPTGGVALNDEADACEFVYRVRALDRVVGTRSRTRSRKR